ncbi:hypothetical protein QFZ87_003639 [Bacillus sp. SLBN-46]|nr:hypothetical protein [Bacillus sp. SLBN-46]MDR6124042.1 hypothetical protein [Bacillus sp. SLBN-46]
MMITWLELPNLLPSIQRPIFPQILLYLFNALEKEFCQQGKDSVKAMPL